jgi:uncharacterized protein
MTGTDQGGRTPLHYAALANNADAVSQLLAEGADPNVADRLGFTPLHFAAQEGVIAAAGLLLAAEAQVDAANSHGNTRRSQAVGAIQTGGVTAS